jgi:hypothetical protein
MTTPAHVITYRVIIVLITLAVLLMVGLGLANLGPLAGIIGTNAPYKVNI